MKRFSNRRKTIAVVLLALVAASQIAAATRLVVPGRRGESRILADCPISWRSWAATVPVTVFGKTHAFLIDTGCTVSILDSEFEEQLGMPFDRMARFETPFDSGSARREQTYRTPDLAIGDFRLPPTFMIPTFDLSILRDREGVICDGILGLDVLRTNVVQIDVDQSRLRVLDSVPDDSGESLPLRHDAYSAFIDVDIRGLGLRSFLVDTGHVRNTDISLDEQSFDALSASQKICDPERRTSTTMAGQVEHACGVIDRIQIGSFVHTHVTVGRTSKSIIGADCLFKNYNLTFDFPGGRLFLKPRAFAAAHAVASRGQIFPRESAWWSAAFPTAGGVFAAFGYGVYVKLPRLRRLVRRKMSGV